MTQSPPLSPGQPFAPQAFAGLPPPSPAIGQVVVVQTNTPGGKMVYSRAEQTRTGQLGAMTAGIGLLVGILLGVGLKAAEGEIFGYGGPKTTAREMFPLIIAAVVIGFDVALTLCVVLGYRLTRPKSTRFVGSEGLQIMERGRQVVLAFAQLSNVDLRMQRQFVRSGSIGPSYTGTVYELFCVDPRGSIAYRMEGVFNDQLPVEPTDPVSFATQAAHAFAAWRARYQGAQ